MPWDTNPASVDYFSQPGADLDLQIVDASGDDVRFDDASYFEYSSSFDNTSEVALFIPYTAGQYTLRAPISRSSGGFSELGWAWWQGDDSPRATPTPAATATATQDPYTYAHGNPHQHADEDAYAAGLGGTHIDKDSNANQNASSAQAAASPAARRGL